MAGEADDSWLDIEPAKPAADLDDWPLIEDANAGKVKLSFQHLIDACMRGTNRVMASDGRHMAYRPFNREFDKETNPRTKERVAMFLADGKWKHLGTYDEVQIYELLEGNAYRDSGKQHVVGKSLRDDMDKVAVAAINRQWVDYHDLLLGMATAMKAGRDPAFAKVIWQDTLTQIAVYIQQKGGKIAPSEKEINEGFTDVRRARGLSKGGIIATLDTSGLQKVGFDGRR